MRLFTIFALPIIALTAFVGTAAAQPLREPYFSGEKLQYEAKLSRFKLKVDVADLAFSVEPGPSAGQMLIKSRAASKGTLIRLFRFSFLQEIESTVDFAANRVYRTQKHDVQKKRVRDSIAEFDYDGGRVSFTETDPTDPRRPPRRIGSEIGAEMHDLISGIYALRRLPLRVGYRFEIPVSDSGLVYRVPGRVVARDLLRTVAGRVWCWRVEPTVFGPGRMIEQKGKMTLWITDDARRLPVRAEIETPYGEIDVKLTSFIGGVQS